METTQTNPIAQKTSHVQTGKRFQHINSEELIEIMESEGFTHTKDHVARVVRKDFAGFQKHALFFDSPFSTDEGTCQIMAVNDHRGSMSLRFYAGYFRVACLNQLPYADANCPCIRISHQGDVKAKIKEAIETMKNYCEQTELMVARYKEVKVTQTQEMDFAKKVVTKLLENVPEVLHALHLNALIIHRPEDNTGSLWALINRVQENCFGGGIRYIKNVTDKNGVKSEKVYKSKKVTSMQRKVELNSFMFDLTSELAGAQ